MKALVWLLLFGIPFVVLYTIGYLLPGFSALTTGWIILLAVLIAIGGWLVIRLGGKTINFFGNLVIMFLIATFIIFTVTLAIEGGAVPLGGALLAAGLVSLLNVIMVRQLINRILVKGSS